MGGEWAGSVLLGTESAPPGRRSFYGMFTQLGLGTALVLANLVFPIVHLTVGDKSSAFLTWGWRLPFLLSVALVGVSLYIRRRIPETAGIDDDARDDPGHDSRDRQPPAPRRADAGSPAKFCSGPQRWRESSHSPIRSAPSSLTTPRCTCTTPRTPSCWPGVLGGLCSMGCVAASAILSDRYGPRRFIAGGPAVAVPWSFALMPIIDMRRPVVFTLAVMVTYAIIGAAMGPLPAHLPGIFATRYRYTATAVSYNIGGILGGALPPVVSPALLHSFGSPAVAA